MSENNGFQSLTQLIDGLNGPLLFQKKKEPLHVLKSIEKMAKWTCGSSWAVRGYV